MTDPTGLDPVLLDLLVEWELRRAAGTPVTPEELCHSCPERAEDLRRQLERIARLEPLMALSGKSESWAIPGFEILAEIGRGGMGVVFKARDLALDRVVAVKIPTRPGGGAVSRMRFEREVRTLAKLRHPHIVSVHVASIAGDTPYLVMEFVSGGSLAERAKEVADTPARAAALVAQVARAVAHAHAAGIVHRDLKPSNILIDERGQPLVTDFGVAALLAGEPVATSPGDTPDEREGMQTRLTRTGAVVGTPAYAAPEALSGDTAPSPPGDVWSLGVVLYECLTGRLPFETEGPVGERMSPTRPRSIRPNIPRDLETVTLRCLSTDPKGRYPTATAVANALSKALRRARFRRAAKSAGLMAVLTCLTFAAVAWLFWPKSPAQRHEETNTRILKRLKTDRVVDLIPHTGWPHTHLVRVNDAVTRAGVSDDEAVFQIESPRPSLVELLPEVPGDRFRLTAQLRHDSGLSASQIGLYFNHARIGDGGSTVHRFVFLAFADVGSLSRSRPVAGGPVQSEFVLRGFGYSGADPPAGVWDQELLRIGGYPPVDVGQVRPWRTLTVDVSPTRIRSSMDGLTLDDYPVSQIEQTFAAAGCPRGGIGVYVSSGKASVRNCRIEIGAFP